MSIYSIYINHLYVEFYVELDINVWVCDKFEFCVIDVIFDEKLLIGKSVDFLWIFCAYIGRKWFRLCVGIWVRRLVKVLISVGFYDIGCDIGIFGWIGWKVGILVWVVGFCLLV